MFAGMWIRIEIKPGKNIQSRIQSTNSTGYTRYCQTWMISNDDNNIGGHWYWQGTEKDYNMTVWHFGPCVTFRPCLCDISARLVWHFGPLVRNEGKRVSPYPHINHRHRLWEIPPIIGIKSNLTTIQQFHRVIADSCFCVRIILTAFKHFDMKGSRYRVTSTASLDDGIVRQQFPVAKGRHVTSQWE